jgi:hypothetical protein
MKNVIAYSLWGSDPKYWKGALRNIEQAKTYFPGWTCRFYIDSNSDSELIESIKGENVETVMVDAKNSIDGMFWRFCASEDPETGIFLSRDCDSRFSNREIYAINEWLASDKDFHIMRDHPYHVTPILGGMWGCRNGILRGIGLSKMMEDWQRSHHSHSMGIDQDFLANVIYRMVLDRSMEHSEFGIRFLGNTIEFPTERTDYLFVGDTFDENDNRHPGYWEVIKKRETK